MPTLPVRLAATSERWFAKPSRVEDVDDLSPGLRRVRFASPDLRGKPWTRGQEIEFRVGDRDFRHYTVAAADPDAGSVDVVFARPAAPGQERPGATWVDALRPGDDVGLLGPGGGVRRRPDGRELFLGDATTLGLLAALAPTNPALHGAVEVPAPDRDGATTLVGTRVEVLEARGEPGRALMTWLEAHPGPVDRACLAGHVGTIAALRRRLRDAGVPRGAIATKAHWADGRRGL